METIASATYGEYVVIELVALLVLQEETKVKITREGTSDLWGLRSEGNKLGRRNNAIIFFFFLHLMRRLKKNK